MKVAFVGKGGSGKSTVTALFSMFLANQNKHILALDADINQHLGQLLGFTQQNLSSARSIGHEINEVRTYCMGFNSRIQDKKHIRMTTPPGNGSRVIYPNLNDEFLSRYLLNKNGILFAMTGEFEDKDVGMICYHGKTMGTEIVLNHLADQKDEYIIVDMTAGADAFSTGIFLKFDLIILVVEPTEQSLSVYNQFKKYGQDYDINLAVIGNKIDSEEDEEIIVSHVGEKYIGGIEYSKEIRNLEKQKEVNPSFIEKTKPIFEKLLSRIDAQQQNWIKFYNNLVSLHIKHADSWLDSSFQYSFKDQIDPDFNPDLFYKK